MIDSRQNVAYCHLAAFAALQKFGRYWTVVSTGRRNTGGQLAINTDDGLPNARPIAFGDSPRNKMTVADAIAMSASGH